MKTFRSLARVRTLTGVVLCSLLLQPVGLPSAGAATTCIVDSPTGSVPARKGPGGKAITNLRNGTTVSYTQIANDARGESFARTAIRYKGRSVVVWVYLNYLNCGVAAGSAEAAPVQTAVPRVNVVYLADKDVLPTRDHYSFNRGSAKVNGVVYTRSIAIDPNADRAGFVEYDLSRIGKRLQGVLGLSDSAQNNMQTRFEIYGDGNKLFDQTIGLGQAVPLDIEITGHLRLRLQATELVGYTQQNWAVFGDIRYST